MIAVHSAWIGSCCTQSVLGAGEGPADQHLPDRALLGAAQRIGLAAGEHGRHAVPEELRAERRDERRDADLGDQHAVDEADQDARRERATTRTTERPPAVARRASRRRRPERRRSAMALLEQHREDEAGEAEDRRESRGRSRRRR